MLLLCESEGDEGDECTGMSQNIEHKEFGRTTLMAALARGVIGTDRPPPAEQPPNERNEGVERPKERKKGKDEGGDGVRNASAG